MIGEALGPYRVLSKLGEGGMGEVYRARDTKLNRDVAIKVLPEAFASDPERLARFTREAQTLAALNHPNIAHIHGLEEQAGVHALVMELVEGEDLAQRLARGPITLDEALPIARQIAEALEAAHDQGIVHRDLKPANVKVRPDGTVKVLDFGLAKALEPPGGPGSTAHGLVNSPTLTARATQMGTILGTAAYMAPEQARGKPVDRRADIWAFGVVVYEMLTGRRAFTGEDISDVLASVLRQEVDWTVLPAETPARLRRLLERCLDRDPKQRLRDIGEARVEIASIESGAADTVDGVVPAVGSPASPRVTGWPTRAAWLLAMLSTGALLVVSWAYVTRPAPSAGAVELTFEPPEGVEFDAASADFLEVSPDGRLLVLTGRSEDGRRQLWLRPLDTRDARPIAGTDDAVEPFWSPDSRSIAFGAHGKLLRVDVSGGRPLVLCDAARLVGGTWNRDGVILFVPDYNRGVFRVSAEGGEPKAVTQPDPARQETAHAAPAFLPDGRHFLFVGGPTTERQVLVGSIDGGEVKLLLREPSVRVAPPGWLLFAREGVLMAQAVDTRQLETLGEPSAVVEFGDRLGEESARSARLSVSNNGVLVWQRPFRPNYQLVWFDRAGERLGTVGSPTRVAQTMAPRLSPDGQRVVMQDRDPAEDRRGIWAFDLARGIPTRLSSVPSQYPHWSPDGNHVAWLMSVNGVIGTYRRAANGVGDAEVVLHAGSQAGGTTFPNDWSADGRFLLYHTRGERTRVDLWVLPLFGDRQPHPLLATEFDEHQAQFSPDGRWIAYRSDASGTYEIYVQPFGPDGRIGRDRWRISTDGGAQPRFRRDGQELFYLSPDGQMMAVAIHQQGATFGYDPPKPLFRTRTLPRGAEGSFEYDVTRDGQRFLVGTILDGPHAKPPRPVVLLNWTEALKSKVVEP